MRRIILARHGESAWNSTRRLQGQADIPLSPRGEEQARQLRATIELLAPDHVVTSDLERARRTAALLGHAVATPDAALREINVGDWTGEAIAELVAASPDSYSGWRAGTFTPPEGETWAAFRARAMTGLERALAGGAQRLLVVCHGGVIRALIEELIGLPPHRILPVGPASLTVIADKKGNMRLEAFNFSPGGLTFDAPD
jgi:probable phosphoglycerate mutase